MVQGDLQIHIHILDRANGAPRPCLQLGAGTFNYRGPPIPGLEERMKRSLQFAPFAFLLPLVSVMVWWCRRECERYRPDAGGQYASPAFEPKDVYLGCFLANINYVMEEA